MIVADASVLVNALAHADSMGHKANSVLMRDPEWIAPEHWKAEAFSAIRGLTLGSKITEHRANLAIGLLPQLAVEQVSLDELLPRMWQLRNAVSGYDAAYVALAEIRGLTLVTADARLARAATTYCRVELAA